MSSITIKNVSGKPLYLRDLSDTLEPDETVTLQRSIGELTAMNGLNLAIAAGEVQLISKTVPSAEAAWLGAEMITNAYVMQPGLPAVACSPGYFGINNVTFGAPADTYVVTVPGEYDEKDLSIVTNSYGNFDDIVTNLHSNKGGGETTIHVKCYRIPIAALHQGSFTLTVFKVNHS